VSFWIDCTPPPVGVMLSLTVPSDEIEITEPKTELTVVLALAAKTTAAALKDNPNPKMSDNSPGLVTILLMFGRIGVFVFVP
jgi:hypothetical protein